jgi:lipoprotein
MKKYLFSLTTLFLLLGCTTPNKISIKEKDLMNQMWVCQSEISGTNIRILETLEFYDKTVNPATNNNEYMNTALFYPKDDKALKLHFHELGSWKIVGNKLFYFVHFLENKNNIADLIGIINKKAEIRDIAQEMHSNYKGQPYKPEELEPTEVTISEFTPNAFTFKQKIASHYSRHGKCITQKKLDEKTLDQ